MNASRTTTPPRSMVCSAASSIKGSLAPFFSSSCQQKPARGHCLAPMMLPAPAFGPIPCAGIVQTPARGRFLGAGILPEPACGRSLTPEMLPALVFGRFPRARTAQTRAHGRFSSVGRRRRLGRCGIVKERFDVFDLARKSIEESLFQPVERLRACFHRDFGSSCQYRARGHCCQNQPRRTRETRQ